MEVPDTIAGRFVLEGEANSGGMGAVYRARDLVTGATVAVKILHGLTRRERFEREASVLAELSHPNVVHYLAHGRTTRDERFIVMEWLEGEDLAARLRRSKLTLPETMTVFEQMCEALSLAHGRGVVHRDVKPSNVFLKDGDVRTIKLLDFGIARLARGAGLTGTGVAIGTPAYMAPEQARGGRELDARVDVFSLGCVVFECLTGKAPFDGDHTFAVLAKVVIEEQSRVRDLVPELPPELDELLERMMAKEPDRRPPDARVVLEQMRRLGPVAGVRVGMSEPQPPAPAITRHEQRVVSVVLAPNAVPDRAASPSANEAPTVKLSPSATVRRTASVDRDLATLVESHGARLENLVDGSIVALLSGGGSATELAERAARCALVMRRLLPRVPITIATGRAEMSARLPIGEVIDRAARWLGRRLRDTDVHLDEVTAGLLDTRFEVVSTGSELYLKGERDATETARTLLGKPAPFVGRNREMGVLEAVVAEAEEESAARAVVVSGSAGVGKSRLRQEFLRRLRGNNSVRPVEVLMARGDPMSAGSSFGFLAQAIRRACGIGGGEPAETQRQKLRVRVARHLPRSEVTRICEFLGEMVDVRFPDEDSVQLRAARHDPLLMGDQIRAAWQDWLGAECKAQPLLLVLEDLHWGDLATVTLVDAALRNLRDLPFVVLALARPELHRLFPELWAGRSVTELRLGDLPRKACERLVREVLGDGVSTEDLAAIVARADGNAFYLEELIRAVAEGHGQALPETVLAMVQGRLDALPTEARRVLRAASVFGRRFWQEGVCALTGGAAAAQTVAQTLGELVSRELVERRGDPVFPGQVEYQFRHALVREAAYATFTSGDRTLGHRLAGAWLEGVGERDAGTLAEHYDRGEEPQKAGGWYRRAAEQAIEGNDLEGAIAWAKRGIACGVTGEDLGHLRLVEAEAHTWSGRPAEAEPNAVAAIECLPAGSRPWYRAVSELVAARGALGQYGRVAAWAKRLVAAPPAEEAASAAIITGARTVIELLRAGRYDIATPLLELVHQRALANPGLDPAALAWEHGARGLRAVAFGELGLGLELLEQATAWFEQTGDARNACQKRCALGDLLLQLGLADAAQRALRDVLASAERMGLGLVAAAAKHSLAMVLARKGRLSDGKAVENEAIAAFVYQGDRRMEGASQSYLAQVHLLSGDAAAAEAEARNAQEALKGAPPLRAEALGVLGRALLAQGKPEAALGAAEEAMGLLESLGGLERGESLVRAVHAESLLAQGRSGEALEAVAAAEKSLALRARSIGENDLRQAFVTQVPDNARILELARALGVPTDLGPPRPPPEGAGFVP